jgi:hypothetical protein
MEHDDPGCRYEKVYTVQFKSLKEDLQDLKDRVNRLESTLARGVLLLVANLVGVIVTLARGLV